MTTRQTPSARSRNAEQTFELGRITQALDTLSGEMARTRNDLELIKTAVDRARGTVAGLVLAAGGLSVAASTGITLLIK